MIVRSILKSLRSYLKVLRISQHLALTRNLSWPQMPVMLVQAVYCCEKMTMVLIILFVTILKSLPNIREITLP